jgi:hypothetical protein
MRAFTVSRAAVGADASVGAGPADWLDPTPLDLARPLCDRRQQSARLPQAILKGQFEPLGMFAR